MGATGAKPAVMQRIRKSPFPRPGSGLIAPSILSANFAVLGTELRKVEKAGCQWVHLDIMDNHFVPNLTFGPPVVSKLRGVSKRLFFDTHLMCQNPASLVEPFAKAGVQLLTFHLEAAKGDAASLAGRIRALGLRVGIAIKPGTPANLLEPLLGQIDLALIMTVEPGFGGQALIPATLSKVSALNRIRASKRLRFLLEVDGGINRSTAELVVAAGADVLVAGSAVFQDGNVARNLQALKSAARME